LKLLLTLLSLSIIYKGVMDTGDPKGLFSNLIIFYSMYLLGYYDIRKNFSNGHFNFIRFFMLFMAGISAIGWLDIITIREIEEQYYVTFSENMRLGTEGIINVHLFFLILCIKSIIFSGMEWVVSIGTEETVNNEKKPRMKGAS
jgi:hypothetical protein